MNRALAPLAVLLLAFGLTEARAEVYRCTVDGKTVYTDKPCAPGAAPAQLPPITPIDRQPTRTPMTRQFDAEAQREAAVKSAANDARLKTYAAKKAHDDGVRSAIIEHRVIKGMTMNEVRQSIGEPTSIEGEHTAAEHWIYQNGRERQTLTFAGDVLKSERARTYRR